MKKMKIWVPKWVKLSLFCCGIYCGMLLGLSGALKARAQGSTTAQAVLSDLASLPSMFGQNPTSFNTNLAESKMNTEMSACLMRNGIDPISSTAQNLLGTLFKGKDALKKCPDFKSAMSSSAVCTTKCEMPVGIMRVPACGSPYFQGPEKSRVLIKDGEPLREAMTIAGNFKAYLDARVSCESEEVKRSQAMVKVYECQLNALNTATNDAGEELNAALKANQTEFKNMDSFAHAVDDQTQKIIKVLAPDEALGGSGSSLFKGYLALEKEIQDSLAQVIAQEKSFESEITTLQKDVDANEQTLESSRVQVISSCIKGERNLGMSGGYSLLCYKPTMGSVGGSGGADEKTPLGSVTKRGLTPAYTKQPCGPVEFIKSQIETAARLNKKGQVMSRVGQGGEREDKASVNSASFDSLMNSIYRDLGDFDGSSKSGKLVTRVSAWSQIQKKYGKQIDFIRSSSGVDVGNLLNAVGTHCVADSNRWKRQQMTSKTSPFYEQVNELERRKNDLTGRLHNVTTQISNNYTSLISVLGDQHVPLNRFSCTETDPSKMKTCLSDIRKNVNALMDGTGLSLTHKEIPGAPSIGGPWKYSCAGLKGCIQALVNRRKVTEATSAAAKGAMQNYTSQANQQTDVKMQAFATKLKSGYSRVLATYDALKKFLPLGVAAPDQPKLMKGEPLKPMEGMPPEKMFGPYEVSANVPAVLANSVPGGLPDFSDTGVGTIREKLGDFQKDENEKAKDAVESFADTITKYSNLETDCLAKVEDKGKKDGNDKNVKNDPLNGRSCGRIQAACEAEEKAKALSGGLEEWVDGLTQLMKNTLTSTDVDEVEKYRDELEGLAGGVKGSCKTRVRACLTFVESKISKYDGDLEVEDDEDAPSGEN